MVIENGVPTDDVPDGVPTDGVQLRTLIVGSLPLLVASVGGEGRSAELRETVANAGLIRLSGFLGAELPRGAKVGFVVEGDRLRLVDERDDALLRAPRSGLDPAWLSTALEKKGTMFLVVDGLDLSDQEPPPRLAARLDDAARDGRLMGAIVGVIEERPTLPLLFQ